MAYGGPAEEPKSAAHVQRRTGRRPARAGQRRSQPCRDLRPDITDRTEADRRQVRRGQLRGPGHETPQPGPLLQDLDDLRRTGHVPGRTSHTTIGGAACPWRGDHQIDHRDADHGFGAVGVDVVDAGRAAVVHE
ncbi:hypothetical protein ACFVWY_28270 [Streptomyces sp. NPDC058195]|uniref:hypothetical protein n=1 Tax=Streptomyces sp. NPDC058195 TaxID=3346375 RepID=UPI0036DFC292